MSTELHFDLLQFYPLSWAGFLRRYVGAVQCMVVWDRIKKPRMGLTVLQPGEQVDLVWYRDGDWRDGEPRKAKTGNMPALARLPAVKLGKRFLVLDGCHRLSEVKPAFVLLDWFEPSREDRVYITDLFNKAFR